MIVIPVINENGGNVPSQPFPSDSIMIVCDGANYICYQTGDDLPEVVDNG